MRRRIPVWAKLPDDAPQSHQRAWLRAWRRVRPPRAPAPSPGSSSGEVRELLAHLLSDPEAPDDLVTEVLTAHFTEGRGAPDALGQRADLLRTALARDLWRTSWLPAALAALLEPGEPSEREALASHLLARARTPEDLRPLVMILALLGRPARDPTALRSFASGLFDAPDVDDVCRLAVARLLRKAGWFRVRTEGLRDRPDLDTSTRGALRRFPSLRLPIPASVVRVITALLDERAAGGRRRRRPARSTPPPRLEAQPAPAAPTEAASAGDPARSEED